MSLKHRVKELETKMGSKYQGFAICVLHRDCNKTPPVYFDDKTGRELSKVEVEKIKEDCAKNNPGKSLMVVTIGIDDSPLAESTE